MLRSRRTPPVVMGDRRRMRGRTVQMGLPPMPRSPEGDVGVEIMRRAEEMMRDEQVREMLQQLQSMARQQGALNAQSLELMPRPGSQMDQQGWALLPHRLVGGFELPPGSKLQQYGANFAKMRRFRRIAKRELERRAGRD